jgi:hypothetical protein
VTPTTIYAGTLGGGVFKSINGGGNWSALNTGLTNTNVYALAINPAMPSIIHAGTNGGGVFSLQQVLAVVSVGPGLGLTTGGTTVTIQGGNFMQGITVTIGSITATNVTLINSTTLTATTGAHAAGAVDVVITNPNNESATLPNGFVYADVIYQIYLPVTRR